MQTGKKGSFYEGFCFSVEFVPFLTFFAQGCWLYRRVPMATLIKGQPEAKLDVLNVLGQMLLSYCGDNVKNQMFETLYLVSQS